jgi:hypothetical protein
LDAGIRVRGSCANHLQLQIVIIEEQMTFDKYYNEHSMKGQRGRTSLECDSHRFS